MTLSRLLPSVPSTLAALLATLSVALPASAANLKVPKDFATLADALGAAQPGDRILLAKAVQAGPFTVDVANLQIIGKKTEIDGRAMGVALTVEADGVTLSGLTIRNGIGGILVNAHGVTINKCQVLNGQGTGIEINGDDATVTGCKVLRNDAVGIVYAAVGDASATLLEGNTIQHNGADGMNLVGGNILVQKNKVDFNGGVGIFLDTFTFDAAMPPPRILNNKLQCNEGHGIEIFESVSGVLVQDNVISANHGDGVNAMLGVLTVVLTNKIQRNGMSGVCMGSSDSLVSSNKITDNRTNGVVLSTFLDGSNDVLANKISGNGRDGVNVSGPGHRVASNSIDKNGGDGVDIETDNVGLQILDNTIKKNSGDGIDNSGLATIITGNTVLKNGPAGAGPDIAGAGDGGGTVSGNDLSQNVFATGGIDTPQGIDI